MIMLQRNTAPSPWQPLNGQGVLRIPSSARRADASGGGGVVRVCTVNVGTLVGRGREVVEMLARRRVEVCCLQEVRYRNKGTTTIGSNQEKYKFWYSGNDEGSNGVGIMVRSELIENILSVERFSDRAMKITLVVGERVCHVFSVYAPQVGRPTNEKEEFWEFIEDEVARVPANEGLIIGGDVNAHVGSDCSGYEDVMGVFGYGQRNAEADFVLGVCRNHDLKIANTYFKKKREHQVTYKSGTAETQVDLVLVRPSDQMRMKDCKAVPGEAVLTQHRPVVCGLIVKNYKKSRIKGQKRVRTWKLKEQEIRLQYRQKIEEQLREGSSWSEYQNIIKTASLETCGETKGGRGRERETWWWNTLVQNAIENKRSAFKIWQRSGNEADKNIYKVRKREAKIAVATAKERAWEEFAVELETLNGKQNMYKLAKQMKKEQKDVVGGKYIKGDDDVIRFTEQGIREVWKDYFNGLLNEENSNEFEEAPPVLGPIKEIGIGEVEAALQGMQQGKAAGPSGVTSDLMKAAGDQALQKLVCILNARLLEESSPTEWRVSYTIPLYKGKGDPLKCNSYRGLRLLEHGMKLWEKVLAGRLRQIVCISEGQFGFMGGRSTIDAIYILRHLQELFLDKEMKLYHIFVDLEKAFDRVPRKAIQWALRRQGVPEQLVKQVMLLYNEASSKVVVAGGESDEFDLTVGVHQGSILSPLLFNIVIEEATRECRTEVPWEMLYADDLVLTARSKKEVVDKFIEWKGALEKRGLKVNIAKTKILVTGKKEEVQQCGRFPCGVCGKGVGVNSILCTVCEKWCHKRCSGRSSVVGVSNFVCPACVRGTLDVDDDSIEVDGQRIEEVSAFCYLGDMLERSGGAERAVRTRVAAAWSKWRELSSLLVNRHLPLVRRARVYEACIRSVLLYGAETWALTARLEQIIRSCDRRMLRYLAKIRLSDRVASIEVLRRCGLRCITWEMRRRRLRWFGHVKRREESEVLGRVFRMEVEGRRRRGRPRKTWTKCVAEDLELQGGVDEDAYDRGRWEKIINRLTPQGNT